MKLIKTLLILLAFVTTVQMNAQDRYLTREGHIKFFSSAPLEDIEANNYKALSIVDLSKGEIAVNLLIKAFEFEKKLMQEHFNENYMESGKYPKSTFKGSFEVPADLKAMKDGSYEVDVTGEMTIHGVKQNVNSKATLTVAGGSLSGKVVLNLKVDDYKIKIPKVVVRNIAQDIEVTGTFAYEPYKKG